MNSYTHTQTLATTDWTINHGLGTYPVCDVSIVKDAKLQVVLPHSVEHVDENTAIVRFSSPFSGVARMIGMEQFAFAEMQFPVEDDTPPTPVSGDTDGVENENLARGTGDGNLDGIADEIQSNVASIQTYGGHWATIEVPQGYTLSDVSNTPAPTSLPRTVKLPMGNIIFKITCPTQGAAVPVNIYFPASLTNISTSWPMRGADEAWDPITATYQDIGAVRKITFTMVDGSEYDGSGDGPSDGVIIHDPAHALAPA